MNVEATQPLDHIFLATHHPVAMYRKELIKGQSQVEYDEEKFLKDFLASSNFAFVPVLGDSGTGKSHLIRWLAANIESNSERRVLLIPKIGTNLKDIINLILEGMDGTEFDDYRQRLHNATSRLTEVQARVQLLNQLAAVVGRDGNHNRAELSEVQDYLVEKLDSLLYDPFFREHWLKPGGIIDSLVIHTLGYQDKVKVIEERQGFSVDDLPLNILYSQKAGEQARNFYNDLISVDEIKTATVEWLNAHLDEAITRVLSLGREDLQRLMREVRESLAEKGIELVLLVEDFAKLQGIDLEVLEAVLAQPQQLGGKPLCAMRTALACTTGYYGDLVKRFDTILQRVTFSVNLDVGAVSNQSLITQADIQQFVARYLNAVRLEDEAILNWANARKEEGDLERRSLTSACNDCEHRQACHTGFGEINGVGFYPFTPKALEQMLSRVNQENFNPRILIKDVLKYTLENSCADIEQGRFPSVSLREHFGKKRLSTIVQDEIRAKDPLNAARREVLLDLWTDSNQLIDLPDVVHTAFQLPQLGVGGQQTPTATVPLIRKTTQELPESYSVKREPLLKQTDGVPDRLAKQLEILNNWNNQAILPQDIEKLIREFVYPAVLDRIEWDTEMLLRGSFASSSQIFKQRNVLIHSPKVRGEGANYSGIILRLPLNPDDEKEFRETAIAFQGVLQYSHYKNWKFLNGDRYFRAYAKQLDCWSQYIVKEIRCRPRESGELWDPVPAAVELLAIAAKMAGHPTNSLEDLVNALFLNPARADEDTRTSTWKKLFDSLKKHHEPLLSIIKSRIACTKGSSNQFQIIDAAQIVGTLKIISEDWQPKCEIPSDLRKEFEDIQKARQQVDELLLQAIQEECDRHLKVYQDLVAELGEELNYKEATEAVKQAMEQAREAGVFGQTSADNLTTVLDKFKRAPIASYMNAMKRVQVESKESNTGKLLQYLSENYQRAMTPASEFLSTTKIFFETSLNRAQNDIADLLSAEGGTVESSHQAIQAGLADLRSLMTEIKGE